jgi:hypothetical protein
LTKPEEPDRLIEKKPIQILKREKTIPESRDRFDYTVQPKPCTNSTTKDELDDAEKKTVPITVAQIGAVPFLKLARKPMHELFSVTLRDINIHLNKQAKPETDPRQVLPEEYHEFLDVFSKKASDELLNISHLIIILNLKETND